VRFCAPTSWRIFLPAAGLAAAVLVTIAGCASRPSFQDPFARPQIDWKPDVTLSSEDAERILGNQARVDRVSAYFEYPDAGAARSFLEATLTPNHILPGNSIRLQGGEELHYLAGGDVVRMVMILQGDRLLRLKVNQVTTHYSLVELKKVAEELARRL
jgi:hypothetical protein